jgi:hypothetical protein
VLAARKTVNRFLQQLEADGKVTQITAKLPADVKQVFTDEGFVCRTIVSSEMPRSGVDGTVQLVVLTEAGSPSSLVESFFQRIAGDDVKRQQVLTEKNQKVRRRGEAVQSERNEDTKVKARTSRPVRVKKGKSTHANSDGQSWPPGTAPDVDCGSDSAEHAVAKENFSDSGSDGEFSVAATSSTKRRLSSNKSAAAAPGSQRQARRSCDKVVQRVNPPEVKNAFAVGNGKQQKPVELAFNQLLRSFDATSVLLKRKATREPSDDHYHPIRSPKRALTVTASESLDEGACVPRLEAMPALDVVISGALATERPGAVPIPQAVVSPHEAILYSHMFSLGDAFGFVQMTTDSGESSMDGEQPSHDASSKQKKDVQRVEHAGKEGQVQVARLAVRCDLEAPVGAEMALRMMKVLGPCHGGHYGPNLNRVHCDLSTTVSTGKRSVDVHFSDQPHRPSSWDSSQGDADRGAQLLPGEVHCPWVSDAGQRHEEYFLALRSKAIMFFGSKPGCDAQQLRSHVLPHLSQDQVHILLSTLENDGFVHSRQPPVSAKVGNPFVTTKETSSSRGYFLLL